MRPSATRIERAAEVAAMRLDPPLAAGLGIDLEHGRADAPEVAHHAAPPRAGRSRRAAGCGPGSAPASSSGSRTRARARRTCRSARRRDAGGSRCPRRPRRLAKIASRVGDGASGSAAISRVLGVVRPVRHLEHHRPGGIVVVRAHHRDDAILEPILSSGQRRDVLAELGALALEVPQRGLGAVEPVGVDRRAARLALQVRGGDLGADRGDGVVDLDQPGAGLGAGRRLPVGRADARGSGRRRSGRSWVCSIRFVGGEQAPGRAARAVRVPGAGQRFQGAEAKPPAGAAGAGGLGWRRPAPAPAAAACAPAPRSSGR